MKKLALGTVQFGVPYGVASGYQQTSEEEAFKILQSAKNSGIKTLDTAINYGSSEEVLGRVGVEGWDVVSKLPLLPEGIKDISGWLNKSIQCSLERLNIDTLYAVLLHHPEQLLGNQGEKLYAELVDLKAQGIVKKIGASIYDPILLDRLEKKFPQDLIQAPFNIFDRRLLSSGWLNKLHDHRVELHVRSIFLQGLLLMDSRPSSFKKWGGLLSKWDQWLVDSNLSALEACLSYALKNDFISKAVIGAHSSEQLNEILESISEKSITIPDEFMCNDLDLIDPSRWN